MLYEGFTSKSRCKCGQGVVGLTMTNAALPAHIMRVEHQRHKNNQSIALAFTQSDVTVCCDRVDLYLVNLRCAPALLRFLIEAAP